MTLPCTVARLAAPKLPTPLSIAKAVDVVLAEMVARQLAQRPLHAVVGPARQRRELRLRRAAEHRELRNAGHLEDLALRQRDADADRLARAHDPRTSRREELLQRQRQREADVRRGAGIVADQDRVRDGHRTQAALPAADLHAGLQVDRSADEADGRHVVVGERDRIHREDAAHPDVGREMAGSSGTGQVDEVGAEAPDQERVLRAHRQVAELEVDRLPFDEGRDLEVHRSLAVDERADSGLSSGLGSSQEQQYGSARDDERPPKQGVQARLLLLPRGNSRLCLSPSSIRSIQG
jgi:hypothetical protein